MGPDAMILVFWMLSFKPVSFFFFSLFSFTLIKRLFSSFLLSAIREVSSAYTRLLIFPLSILIPACVSSSLAFLMMYFAYKLNKQDDNIQPCRTPFPILRQSVVPCLVLTVASSLAWVALRNLNARFIHSSVKFPLEIYTWPYPGMKPEPYSDLWSRFLLFKKEGAGAQ